MKKRTKIIITVLIVWILLILLVPIPVGTYNDGEAKVYNAIVYRIVKWNKELPYATEDMSNYESVGVYFFGGRYMSIEELWHKESREIEYTGEWMEKREDQKKKEEEAIYEDGIARYGFDICAIYSNCFFANYGFDGEEGTKVKVNGQLSEDFCVGDHVGCEISNVYEDEELGLIEGDLVSLESYGDKVAIAKPVIYLYPEEEMDVEVKLDIKGELTCTYPKYNNGWKVCALPNGTLTDLEGKEYNYLYWEAESQVDFDMSKGFCVKGEDTAAFLEEALESLGLNRKEANEFIIYWLPMMESNPYNIISFQMETYTDLAKLDINPVPDTLIRVFMAWSSSNEYVEMEVQELSAPVREGFCVVEWGGSEIK